MKDFEKLKEFLEKNDHSFDYAEDMLLTTIHVLQFFKSDLNDIEKILTFLEEIRLQAKKHDDDTHPSNQNSW